MFVRGGLVMLQPTEKKGPAASLHTHLVDEVGMKRSYIRNPCQEALPLHKEAVAVDLF